MTEQQYLNMGDFDKLINELDLEFGMYNDKIYIHRQELAEVCRAYAIRMCQIQRENCVKYADYEIDRTIDENSILNAPLPEELQ